jgi:hypothetical protein
MIVRYEQMVSDPENTLRQVCTFLDEDFYPSMLLMQNAPRFRSTTVKEGMAGGSPMTTEYVGCYWGILSSREITFIQACAGRAMREFGYTPAPVNLTAADRAQLLLYDSPVNLWRLLVWSIVPM